MTYPPGSDPHGGGPAQPQGAPIGEPTTGEPHEASWWETRGQDGQASGPTAAFPQDAPTWVQTGVGPQAGPAAGFTGGRAQPQDAGWAQTGGGQGFTGGRAQPQDAGWAQTGGGQGFTGGRAQPQDAGWAQTVGPGSTGGHAQPQDAGWAQTGGPGLTGGQAQPYDAGWGQTGTTPQPGFQQPGYQRPGYQPAWSAQPGYPGGSPTPQRRTGLIAGIAAGVVVLLVIGIALVVTFANHRSATPTAAPKPPAAPTVSAAPASSSPVPTAPASSGRLSYTQYAKNWDFKLDSVQLHADWVEGRDDSTCAPVEATQKFTELGCRYTAELVYRAEGGALMLTQFIMGMSDPAEAAAAPGKYTDADLKLRPGTHIPHFAVGKWQGGAQGQFLVTTIVTATQAVPEATAVKYLHYMQADMVSALMWR